MKIRSFISISLMGLVCFQLQAQVKIAKDLSSIGTSDVAYVMSGDKKLALITHEYLAPTKTSSSEELGKRLFVVYLSKDGQVDFSRGYTLDGGLIVWDYSASPAAYTFNAGDSQYLFLSKDGKVSSTAIDGANDATFQAIELVDVRGEEKLTYPIVKIANKLWMKKNLATKLYNDGQTIPTGFSQADWMKLESPAVTVFNTEAHPNEAENLKKWGALYNFYAASEPRIAPKEWKVPSDEDFATLVSYIDPKGYIANPSTTNGMESEIAGKHLKSVSGWRNEHLSATGSDPMPGDDLSGFSAVGAGSTSSSKYFAYSGDDKQAYFWTTTPYEDKKGMMRRFYWDSNVSNRWFNDYHYGQSIRCWADLTVIGKLPIESSQAVGKVVDNMVNYRIINDVLSVNAKVKILVIISDVNGRIFARKHMVGERKYILPRHANLILQIHTKRKTITTKVLTN